MSNRLRAHPWRAGNQIPPHQLGLICQTGWPHFATTLGQRVSNEHLWLRGKEGTIKCLWFKRSHKNVVQSWHPRSFLAVQMLLQKSNYSRSATWQQTKAPYMLTSSFNIAIVSQLVEGGTSGSGAYDQWNIKANKYCCTCWSQGLFITRIPQLVEGGTSGGVHHESKQYTLRVP